jgi:hypothetical protein
LIILSFPLRIDISLQFKPPRIFLGCDRALNGGGDDFDSGMIGGGIDHCYLK